MAAGGGPHARQVDKSQMNVIKQIGRVMLRQNGRSVLVSRILRRLGGSRLFCGLPARFLHRELSNYLRLPLVEELEVLFLEISNRATLTVANYHRHEHQIDFGLKRRRGVMCGHLGAVFVCSLRRCLGRSQDTRPEGQQETGATQATLLEQAVECGDHQILSVSQCREPLSKSRQFYSFLQLPRSCVPS